MRILTSMPPVRPDHHHRGGVEFAVLQQQLFAIAFEFLGEPLKEDEFLVDADGIKRG